jgi:hypothetical protein
VSESFGLIRMISIVEMGDSNPRPLTCEAKSGPIGEIAQVQYWRGKAYEQRPFPRAIIFASVRRCSPFSHYWPTLAQEHGPGRMGLGAFTGRLQSGLLRPTPLSNAGQHQRDSNHYSGVAGSPACSQPKLRKQQTSQEASDAKKMVKPEGMHREPSAACPRCRRVIVVRTNRS